MKSGALWVALADFGRDPRSSDTLRGRQNFFCQVNNARFHRFPVGHISRKLNTTTSIGVAMNTFKTEFWQFYRTRSFFQKAQKFLTKFQRLAILGRQNAIITDRPKFTTKRSLYTGCLVSIFIRPKRCFVSGESWKYSTGQKHGVHAFGSAESKPIWRKSGTVWAKCWELVWPGRFWARSVQ